MTFAKIPPSRELIKEALFSIAYGGNILKTKNKLCEYAESFVRFPLYESKCHYCPIWSNSNRCNRPGKKPDEPTPFWQWRNAKDPIEVNAGANALVREMVKLIEEKKHDLSK